MYEKFYELTERPFSLLPDPDFLFLSDKHRTGLDTLELAVFNHSGFCVVSGEIGAGKTTLIRELLNRLDDSICTGLVSNTHASFGVLMQWIMAAYNLPCDTDDRVELHRRFIDFVIQQYAAGKHTLLIIDEAQNLSLDAMEELRMLSNINTEKDLVLQVILVGQGELQEMLQRPELRQFMQRIAINYHLTGLNREETAAYIRHRVTYAGGSHNLFDASACDAVFHYTGGIPRLINRICDLGLVYGYSEASPVINAALISAVAGEHWPGEFPELPEEIKRSSTQGVVGGEGADQLEPTLPAPVSPVSDEDLQADLRPVRRPSVVQASDGMDSPLGAGSPSESMDELKHWQSPLDDDVPPPRKRGRLQAIAWVLLIAVGSGAGVLWMEQGKRLVSSDSRKQLATGSENVRSGQDNLEAVRVEDKLQEEAQRREAERLAREQELARQREAERLAREQEMARQREAERLAREQELARQREAERLAREQELARQREAERPAREQELARQREAAREAHEQELARQREAERKKRELARLKEAEQREQQRLARERRRVEELRLEKERRAEVARRRAAARAALDQMSKEISWADDEL